MHISGGRPPHLWAASRNFSLRPALCQGEGTRLAPIPCVGPLAVRTLRMVWTIRKAFPDPGLAGAKGPSLVPQAYGKCRQWALAHDANPGRIVLPCPCAFCTGGQPVFSLALPALPCMLCQTFPVESPWAILERKPALGLSYGIVWHKALRAPEPLSRSLHAHPVHQHALSRHLGASVVLSCGRGKA